MTKQVDPIIRTFILAAVGLAVAIWDISFNMGAYGTIFFEKLFLIWVGCTAVLLATLVLPLDKQPINRWGRIALFMPTLWFISVAVDSRLIAIDINNAFSFFLATVANLISLPFAFYILLSITQAETMRLELRYILALIGIATVIGLIGYSVGATNYLFLNCQDFAVSGAALPTNCFDGGTGLTAP